MFVADAEESVSSNAGGESRVGIRDKKNRIMRSERKIVNGEIGNLLTFLKVHLDGVPAVYNARGCHRS